ncbi:Dedicator of cytokinesis protein [Trichinella pseudospiralis]
MLVNMKIVASNEMVQLKIGKVTDVQMRKKRNFCQQGKSDQKEQRSRLLSSIDYSGRRFENLFRSVKPNNGRLWWHICTCGRGPHASMSPEFCHFKKPALSERLSIRKCW